MTPENTLILRVRHRIEKVIHQDKDSGFAGAILCIFSLIYKSAVSFRAFLYEKNILRSRSLPCFVISVGNITAGGTGKTPMTLYLARLLQKSGYSVCILSRGYGGTSSKKGGIVSDGKVLCMTVGEVGDEPFMMARQLKNIPVVIGRNRYAAGMSAIEKFRPDIILLDDAYQHLKIRRNLNLLLSDCKKPFGNGHVLPRGPLREALSALKRADAFIVTRCGENPLPPDLKHMAGNRPVFRCSHQPRLHCMEKAGRKEKGDISELKDCRVFLFSGIARNEDFHHTAQALGCIIAGTGEFPDHHPYSDSDIAQIRESAQKSAVQWIVTTEKDYMRMPDFPASPVFKDIPLAVIGIEIDFGKDSRMFQEFIRKALPTVIALKKQEVPN
ncbi:MAG: tetraacyldisaccharide 4'-kinase [Desulfococcaceae bacterium]|jgi:tetraacyldisaccharide 4'-kinase|nr:tetraacyldisaccharide 4'-kinase [Desulfococcaceae bacterium]